MRPVVVVPSNPRLHRLPRLGEIANDVRPDALLLEAAKEALDQPVLLGRVRRDELLGEPVVAAGGPKAPTLKHQPLSLRITGVVPAGRRVPKRAKHASSNARSASWARPRNANS